MPEWAIAIVASVIGAVIGSIITQRLSASSKVEERLSRVESRVSFIEGKFSNLGQSSIAELTQKQAIQDGERIAGH